MTNHVSAPQGDIQAGTQSGARDEGLRRYMLTIYNLMGGGLLLSALTAFVTAETSIGTLFFTDGPALEISPLGWVALLAPFVCILGLGFCVKRGYTGTMYVLYWVMTATFGIGLTPLLMTYTGASVVKIFLITAIAFGGLSLYGYTTGKSLSGIGSFCLMGIWGLLIAGLVNAFLRSPAMDFVMAAAGVVIFSGLIAYDTQRLKLLYDDRSRTASLEGVAIMGAASLYVSFLNLFLSLLELFGEKRKP